MNIAKPIRVLGCRRSGNQAIIEWIARHYNTTVHHKDLTKNWKGAKIHKKERVIEYTNLDREGHIVIHSFEDQTVVDINPDILILRSAYNVASSRIAVPANKVRKLSTFLKVWTDHARSVLDEPLHHVIIYDNWLNRTTRRSIDLGLPLPHLQIQDNHPKKCEHSTFEDDSNYLERYRQKRPPQEVLDNEEIRSLNYRIFGWTLLSTGEFHS